MLGRNVITLLALIAAWASAATPPKACLSSEFICTTSGTCLASSKRCNGVVDCNDGSDENCCNQNSNSGKKFVLGFIPNLYHSSNLVFFLTSDKSLNYSVSCPGQNWQKTGSLKANTLVSVVPPRSYAMRLGLNGNNGFLITSTEDMVVYGLNQAPFITDAFLALPTYIQRYEYVVSSYKTRSGSPSVFGVVAIEDTTTVTVLAPFTLNDGSKSYAPNTNHSFVLNSIKTALFKADDVTGTRVFSDKIVSVFAGHECANVPSNIGACDHLVQQIPPVATLGRRYATAPLATRTAGDIFRVVAAHDGTDVTVDGKVTKSGLSAGTYHEFKGSSSSYLSVETSKPAMFVQYAQGSQADRVVADPFMLIMPPIEQFRDRYTVSTPAAKPVAFNNFVGLIVPEGQEQGIRLDDQPLPKATVWNDITGQKLKGATLKIAIGTHTIHHILPVVKFGLIVYGFANYDSYGYPGGLQLQADCSVKPKSSDVNECATNNGRGPCDHYCNNTYGSFQCSCKDGFVLEPDLRTCGKSLISCSCANNGICRKGGFCECRLGWGGVNCTEPRCNLVNNCSGRGKCVAPNKCDCAPGWSGFGCAVDTCPQYQSCSACVCNEHCGWCDTTRRCVRGDGDGPSDALMSCPAWFPHACVAVASGQGDLPVLSQFSVHVKVINCDASCGLSSVLFRGNSVRVYGTKAWCSRRKRACVEYYNCYQKSQSIRCPVNNQRAVACRVFTEQRCTAGRPPISLPALPPATPTPIIPTTLSPPVIGGGGGGIPGAVISVLTPLNLHFHIYCATGEKMSNWDGYGCWCDQSSYDVDLSPRLPVDDTDKCCFSHKVCYDKAPDNCDCHSTSYGVYSPTCANWKLQNGYCDEVFKLNRSDTCRKHCCECDYQASQCLRRNRATKRDDLWRKWVSTDKGQCTKTCGSEPGCSCDRDCSGHGVMTGAGRDSFCLCFPGWAGKCCDQADCSCRHSNGLECSGNGLCKAAVGDGNPSCSCKRGWTGACCERRNPIRCWGDPHCSTADGRAFDYMGIGEFWACRSKKNDFGAQFRLFGYRSVSLTGGVALKTGDFSTSVLTIGTKNSGDTLPRIRTNGTLLSSDWSKYPMTYDVTPDIKLYVKPRRSGGSVVDLVFQFSSGVVYSVHVRYSGGIGRQYIDTEFGITPAFYNATEGLCGIMDNDVRNDFTGPAGKIYSKPKDFGDSWKVKGSGRWTREWSWLNSNFHPNDPMDGAYTNPFHVGGGSVGQLPANDKKVAEDKCKALGLAGALLQGCILDRGLTGDDDMLQAPILHQGKCPNQCSNRGSCINAKCQCVGTWSGDDCNTGGCVNCPANSQCINGFCECNVGYYGKKCDQALCTGVRDCSAHGSCIKPDVCSCNPGYTGADCRRKAVCLHGCSGSGICLGNEKCLCNVDWTGSKCDVRSCESLQFCSGNGKCLKNGTCECLPGWEGSACDQYACDDLNDCNGNGDCTNDSVCSCYAGFTGPACTLKTVCPSVSNCSGNGICLNETKCQCYSGYYGDTCEKFECTKGCSGRGTCEAPETCSCILGWTGFDCSTPSCEQLHYCSGHGRCAGVNYCECDDNWTGTLCNIFTCNSNNRSGNCSHHGNCSTPGQCSCDKDYCGNDCEYKIRDECRLSNPCSHICTDTCESFRCSCPEGYQLGQNERTCTDIDECDSKAYSFRLNNCEQICVNTMGSYNCRCKKGYSLAKDKISCQDTDECSDGSHNCEQLCKNTISSFVCLCRPGFVLGQDGVSCIDVNECGLDTHDCDQICLNNEGSYSCGCKTGYLLAADKKSCDEPPTAADQLVADGLVNVTLRNKTEDEFMELKTNFSKRVKDAANKFCPGSLVPVEDCSLDDYLLFVHIYDYVFFEGDVVVVFYVMVYGTKTLHIEVLPANVLADIVEENKQDFDEEMVDIGPFYVALVGGSFQPTEISPTNEKTTTSSSSPFFTSAVFAAVVASSVGAISLLILIFIAVWYCSIKSKSKAPHSSSGYGRKGKFDIGEMPSFHQSGHLKGMAVANPVFQMG